jgi:hypothetical protein
MITQTRRQRNTEGNTKRERLIRTLGLKSSDETEIGLSFLR